MTIHSEVTDLYYDQEGYVGMASAGPNTESAQWFITLSPTPHLDGRYTIFGKVSSGMSTVLQLEVGDVIQDIIRID
jgi:cyclophilin family peptidyl-prolyl cis-trans isomerase